MKVQPEVRDSNLIRGTGAPRDSDGGAPIISRAGFGKAEVVVKEEDKKEESKRPTFTKRRDDNQDSAGFMSRSAMGTQKAEETKGGADRFGTRS